MNKTVKKKQPLSGRRNKPKPGVWYMQLHLKPETNVELMPLLMGTTVEHFNGLKPFLETIVARLAGHPEASTIITKILKGEAL
jgi:hypothetical protein